MFLSIEQTAAETHRRATEVYISYPHSCDGGRYQRPSLISLLTGMEQKAANCIPGENTSQTTAASKGKKSFRKRLTVLINVRDIITFFLHL